ncbi:Undecaprenyl diphosphate synthase [Rozella allomycis CSF55]|uniref:Undecaprenyl diphosphate synthase n=1 Tax=Rozella allomycis (strain CSF55) TaxID=988480 RepID=A0A4P9YHG0_ROZAC|nr:Undecaprenyl diphosphate synthase [Rozella allomycis CSF55]
MNRPKAEIEGLLSLFREKLNDIKINQEVLTKNKIRIKFIGDIHLLKDPELRVLLIDLMKATETYDEYELNICVAYSSTVELKSALSNMPTDTSYENLHLDVPSSVDVVIRTSGEIRLSDFLMWQVKLRH